MVMDGWTEAMEVNRAQTHRHRQKDKREEGNRDTRETQTDKRGGGTSGGRIRVCFSQLPFSVCLSLYGHSHVS